MTAILDTTSSAPSWMGQSVSQRQFQLDNVGPWCRPWVGDRPGLPDATGPVRSTWPSVQGSNLIQRAGNRACWARALTSQLHLVNEHPKRSTFPSHSLSWEAPRSRIRMMRGNFWIFAELVGIRHGFNGSDSA